MRIVWIDASERSAALRRLFTAGVDWFAEEDAILAAEDVVFVHLSHLAVANKDDTLENEAQDIFGNVNQPSEGQAGLANKLRQFREQLRMMKSQTADSPIPRLVIYSGDGITSAMADLIKATFGATICAWPESAIVLLSNPIDRNCSGDAGAILMSALATDGATSDGATPEQVALLGVAAEVVSWLAAQDTHEPTPRSCSVAHGLETIAGPGGKYLLQRIAAGGAFSARCPVGLSPTAESLLREICVIWNNTVGDDPRSVLIAQAKEGGGGPLAEFAEEKRRAWIAAGLLSPRRFRDTP